MKTGIIYKATSKISGKVYIGITTDTLHNRKIRHFYSAFNRYKKYGYNRKLSRALREYGKDNFIWEILCDNVLESALGVLEIKTISKYNSYENGYNSTSGGKSKFTHSNKTKIKISKAITGIVRSKETKEKLSKIKRGKPISKDHAKKLHAGRRASKNSKKHNLAISQFKTGKTHSKESKIKISKAGIGRTHSEESKTKMSVARKGDGNANAKLTWDIVIDIRKRYKLESITHNELAIIYNISKSTIGYIIRNKTWKE